MKKANQFSSEVGARAVRMVREHWGDSPLWWAAIESTAPKMACVPQTPNEWVKREKRDARVRGGISTFELQRVKVLQGKNKELRKVNETLKLASAFGPKRSSPAVQF